MLVSVVIVPLVAVKLVRLRLLTVRLLTAKLVTVAEDENSVLTVPLVAVKLVAVRDPAETVVMSALAPRIWVAAVVPKVVPVSVVMLAEATFAAVIDALS